MEENLARIDPTVFQALCNKAKETQPNITRRAIYNRIRAVRREFGNTISPRMAANVLASRMEIDIYRIIKNKSELEELRGLRSRTLMRDLLKETLPRIVPKKKKAVVPKKPSRRVFIVHGRDNKPVKELKILLTQFGLKPIILHEQPSGSRTIVEKLEKYSNVGFAFVILTPDDIGCSVINFRKAQKESLGKIAEFKGNNVLEKIIEEVKGVILRNMEKRARQNVVLEFGYFMGLLSRDKVCCLYTGEVKLPSDMRGIVYVHFKNSVTEVKEKISKELKAVGYNLK